MPGRNGTAPDIEQHADPTGVFARAGKVWRLGPHEVCVKILTVRELKAQREPLLALTYTKLDGTPGEMYFSGASSNGDYAPLCAWLSQWCEPAVTEAMLDEATPDEAIALIDGIFEQNGLGWLRRFLGNEAAAARIAMTIQAVPPPASEPTGGEKSSMTSITSSSTSPDRPPTPESISPETG